MSAQEGCVFLGCFQLVALTVFLVTVVVRTIRLLVRKKVNPITLRFGEKGVLGVMELLLFVGVAVWALAVVKHALPQVLQTLSRQVSAGLLDSSLARGAGVFLIIVAFIIHTLALRTLGDSWRLGIDLNQPGDLVTDGIYALSRNPIYLFFNLYFFGTFLINGTPFFLIMVALTATNLHYQILEEEKFLSETQGIAYEAYRARTGRYVTWPRRKPAYAKRAER